MGSFIVFGDFGPLTESVLAQSVIACGAQVVACGEKGACPRGGVGGAMSSAVYLRALDQAASNIPSSTKPLLVASTRPEVQLAVQQLVARGCDVALAAPDEVLKNPPALVQQVLGSSGRAAARRLFRWPQLYPFDSKVVKPAPAPLMHGAAHTPRKLPAWL